MALAVTASLIGAGCGASHAESRARRAPAPNGVAVRSESAAASAAPESTSTSTSRASAPHAAQNPEPDECPAEMVHVKKDFCPKLHTKCLKQEYDKPNHLTICQRFSEEAPSCAAPRIPLDFCIDVYEYPNRKGAHPPVLVDWYEAAGFCAAEGKRLCYESEWTAACEGPEERPFPYGFERSAERCNIDNRWIAPDLGRVYSPKPQISRAELERLDESVPSGTKPGCVSGYGVFDLTGNLDEWVRADHDRPKEKSKFAALKGGAWGHVRNACRPVTTSHEPEFRYYFVSFRCCKDAANVPRSEPGH